MTLSKSKTSSLAVSTSSGSSSQNGASSNNSFNKRTNNYQECADCSSPSALWASLNHGVVVCDQCCLAHRSLGRAISIIKSLKKSYWPQSQIDTLYELVRNNSNSIWEANIGNPELMKHSLLKNLKKPTPKDAYSTKFNYIKIKYENLSMIARSKYSSIDELNQQLMASVRTNDLKSTLRILSQGADANYRNPEDGNQCLHAAVLANEIGQIELLCLYGADVTGLERNGMSPVDLAKTNGFYQIADRLVELQFELTDDLSFFLCNKRPDHKNGQHFLVPDRNDAQLNIKEIVNRLKLDDLPDHLFEELAKDIFDEMDRRQIESIWKCTVSQNLVNEPIPFLVIKSCFTQMRNQLRQKLARFNSNEFSSILLEILSEAQRRYNHIENPAPIKEAIILGEEEDPLYDKVPSDEDYASVASESSSTFQVPSNDINQESSHLTTITPPPKPSKLSLSLTSNKTQNNGSHKLLTSPKSHQFNSNLSDSSPSSPINESAAISPTDKLSNKNTPSKLFPSSKEHKILNTRFEKVPIAAASGALASSNLPTGVININNNCNNSALVANAESCLNSIINSLNQIDYSNLNATNSHRNHCGVMTDTFDVPQSPNGGKFSMLANFNGRADLYTELKNENELMQAMIERLMDENAQLRAEKMLISAAKNSAATSTPFSDGPSPKSISEELTLYSTIKNKKSEKQIKLDYHQHAYLFDEHSINPNFYDDNSNLEIIEEGVYEYEDSAKDESNRAIMASSKDKTPKSSSSTPSAQSSASLGCNSKNGNNTSLPTKDSVIKAMKKITKAVQDLFKATKLSDFSSLKSSCEKVNQVVNEMIILFPANVNSSDLEENLINLEGTCKRLTDLMNDFNSKIELLAHSGAANMPLNDSENIANGCCENKQMLTSSSSLSAISTSPSENLTGKNLNEEDVAIKNMIVTNLVSYSYEIAHTVKRIVCAMGAEG